MSETLKYPFSSVDKSRYLIIYTINMLFHIYYSCAHVDMQLFDKNDDTSSYIHISFVSHVKMKNEVSERIDFSFTCVWGFLFALSFADIYYIPTILFLSYCFVFIPHGSFAS